MAASNNETRDTDLIRHMKRYCEDAMEAVSLAKSEDTFAANRVYQHAVAMCVLEIGELARHLSEDFLHEHAEIPWRSISRMRDMYAHHYHATDVHQLWITALEDLPELMRSCEMILQ